MDASGNGYDGPRRGILTLAITTRWKISLHLVGAAGAVRMLTLLFGPIALVLGPLVVLVGWACSCQRAHTVAQVVAGTLLAVAVTVMMFDLLGLL